MKINERDVIVADIESNQFNDFNENNKDFEISIDLNKTSILLHHVPVDGSYLKILG